MDLDFDDVAARSLREYVRRVTAALGLNGESSYVDTGSPLSAYLALDGHLPERPGRDVALLWDELHGWSAAVETDGGTDLVPHARLEGDIQPPPHVVAAWARSVLGAERSAAA
ncbi:DUF6292 family protein [Saccharothrix obliqua]|uniref:DUF6292 family protein n=1 Tax=Saccharothrix obliqua TaxID=2861747 RepID=UPI001C604889|nr:DUF6292 family protein [Saccharothrix obliqua]MBW4716751.1 hypothetical protein [Saccharothrix obliqua]